MGDTEETFVRLPIPNGKSSAGYRIMRDNQRAQDAYLEAKRREADASRAMLVSAPQVRFLDPKTLTPLRTTPETQVKSKNAKLEGWLLLKSLVMTSSAFPWAGASPLQTAPVRKTSSTFAWAGASPLQTAPVRKTSSTFVWTGASPLQTAPVRKTSIMATASKSRKQMRVELRKAEKARPVFSLDVPKRAPRDVTQQLTELLDE